MLIARLISSALSDLCPGLSAEAIAAALGIQLAPAPCARYRYIRWPAPRVEYDSLAVPAEQEQYVQRAIVLHCIDTLIGREARAASMPVLADVTREVFEALRVIPQQRSA